MSKNLRNKWDGSVKITDWDMRMGMRVIRPHKDGLSLWFVGRLRPHNPAPTFGVTLEGQDVGDLYHGVYGHLGTSFKPVQLLYLTYCIRATALVKVSGVVSQNSFGPPDFLHLQHKNFSFFALDKIDVPDAEMWHVAREFEKVQTSFSFGQKPNYTPFLESQDISLLGAGPSED